MAQEAGPVSRRWRGPSAALAALALCGVSATAARPQLLAWYGGGAPGGGRRLQGEPSPHVYCTPDMRGYVDHTVPDSPVKVQCPQGLTCMCSTVEENEDLWHCRGEAAAAPCGWTPGRPTSYPKEVFFAAFKADMVSRYSGSSAIWNSTGWWVYDAKGLRQRMDITTHVRSLSSGSHLDTFRHSTRTLPADVAGAEGAGERLTLAYDASSKDLFLGGRAPSCQRGEGGNFPVQPLSGDALRFLPAEFRPKGWSTHTDRYLGSEYRDGRNLAIWGWTQMRGNMEVGGHRVWLDSEGTPVREEQWNSLGGQGTHATVSFQRPENAYSSFGALQANTDELFRLPKSCQLV